MTDHPAQIQELNLPSLGLGAGATAYRITAVTASAVQRAIDQITQPLMDHSGFADFYVPRRNAAGLFESSGYIKIMEKVDA